MELLERVDALGGAARAIEGGFFQQEIARSAYEHQLRVERGETVIVGVNRFAGGVEAPVVPAPDYSALERSQAAGLAELRSRRDHTAVRATLGALGEAAGAGGGRDVVDRVPLMPLIVDAVRARATVGEISDVLRSSWGVYRPTV